MNISAPFIRRPVAATLLTLAIVFAGTLAYFKLPLAAMPKVNFPEVFVEASMPGARPETMAASVATPLERHLSAIADVSEMFSQSSMGSIGIDLTFGLGHNLDGAARDVQAAINAGRADLPAGVNTDYVGSNTYGEPALFLSLTSATLGRERVFDIAQSFFEQKRASVQGVSKAYFGGSSRFAIRVELNRDALSKYGIGLEDVRAALAAANANSPNGAIESGGRRFQIYTNDQANKAADYRSLVVAYRNGLAVTLADVAEVINSVEIPARWGSPMACPRSGPKYSSGPMPISSPPSTGSGRGCPSCALSCHPPSTSLSSPIERSGSEPPCTISSGCCSPPPFW